MNAGKTRISPAESARPVRGLGWSQRLDPHALDVTERATSLAGNAGVGRTSPTSWIAVALRVVVESARARAVPSTEYLAGSQEALDE